MNKIILYSTGCPSCNVLKKKLAAKGIQFEENNDQELIDFFNRMNNKYKHWMNSYIRYVLNEYVNKINQTK